LERDPKSRLSDASLIKAHPYFKSTDWDQLLRKEIPAPFIPPVVQYLLVPFHFFRKTNWM
jgi:serum/glucocorticoid-regulated kinase 2